MTLGQKIQQLRKASGISQEQLAEQLHVSRQSVSKWELDDAVPELSKIILLSDLFAITIDELLRDSPRNAGPSPEPEAPASHSAGTNTSPRGMLLSQLARINTSHQEILTGFKTMILGLFLLVVDFLLCWVYQLKEQIIDNAWMPDITFYFSKQPMPVFFFLTALIIAAGLILMGFGFVGRYMESRS